jgi:hypothetical protein
VPPAITAAPSASCAAAASAESGSRYSVTNVSS